MMELFSLDDVGKPSDIAMKEDRVQRHVRPSPPTI